MGEDIFAAGFRRESRRSPGETTFVSPDARAREWEVLLCGAAVTSQAPVRKRTAPGAHVAGEGFYSGVGRGAAVVGVLARIRARKRRARSRDDAPGDVTSRVIFTLLRSDPAQERARTAARVAAAELEGPAAPA